MKNLTQKLCFIASLLLSANAYCQGPKLNSLLTAAPTIFLDFDGQTVHSAFWQNGNVFVCAPSTFNDTQIIEVFNRVSEDFRPFAVNVTTDSTVYLAAPLMKRTRIIVTTTSAWQPGVGGISFTGTFGWGTETPAFVFADRLSFNVKNIAECCTHETGHTLGLAHQAKYDGNCTFLEEYNSGTGTGQTAWAPVMGSSYSRNMTGWNDGPTPDNCSNIENNLSRITNGDNGFTYRTDDYTETMNLSTTIISPIAFSKAGVISTPTDRDAFKLDIIQAGPMHFDVDPYHIGANNEGADLDVMMQLYNGLGTLIRTYNPLDMMNISADTTLNIGTYYIVISGAGNSNTTNYGSLGSYTFSGAKGTGTLAIHSVKLQGNISKSGHNLTWNTIADEPIVAQLLEASDDGIHFHTIMTADGTPHNYTYLPSSSNAIYYRLSATSSINQTMISNIVVLKSGADKKYTVSTLVQDRISVNASDNYAYALLDGNGRVLETGKNMKGSSNINLQRYSKGMYILQMVSDDYKQTERIIKQ